MKKRKKVNRGTSGKGKTANVRKSKSSAASSTAVKKKRDYSRSPYQKEARKGNDLLRELEEKNITSDNIETIKSALKILNQGINKKGRQDRFYSGNMLSDEDKKLFENLVNELDKEVKNIRKELSSKDRKQHDDYTDQDYIDESDVLNDIMFKSFSELGLSSQQIKDITDIAKDKGLHMDQINDIKVRILERMALDNLTSGLDMRAINIDKFSEYMRNELYNV